MTDTKFIPYARQSINAEDIEAVSQALSQTMITRGALVEAFEEALAKYCGVSYAVAFSNGSTALLGSYYAADVGPADRIITTPNTFVSTASSGVQRGATPMFIDIDPTTGNFDLEQLALNINRPSLRGKTVVVPVHFSGIPVDVQAIDKMIADERTVIIEDAAHAIGSRYKTGEMVGSCAFSHMTIFSFHPAKTITTGEGGMVTTNDPELYRKLQQYRNNCIEKDPRFLQGKPEPWYYEAVGCSSNYNVTEMQAALGLSQLKRLDRFIEKRQHLLKLYKKYLVDFKHVRLLSYENPGDVAPHLCVARINYEAYRTTRTKLMESLKEEGIGTQVHYIPLYRHPVFADRMGDLSEYFPKMESYYQEALSLPLYYDLTDEEVFMIVKKLKKYLGIR